MFTQENLKAVTINNIIYDFLCPLYYAILLTQVVVTEPKALQLPAIPLSPPPC